MLPISSNVCGWLNLHRNKIIHLKIILSKKRTRKISWIKIFFDKVLGCSIAWKNVRVRHLAFGILFGILSHSGRPQTFTGNCRQISEFSPNTDTKLLRSRETRYYEFLYVVYALYSFIGNGFLHRCFPGSGLRTCYFSHV